MAVAISERLLEDTVIELMRRAAISLPADMLNALEATYAREESATAKGQVLAILNNCKVANQKQISLCQDTGMPMVFADVGLKCQLEGDPRAAITRAIEKATKDVPLRENVINPLTKANSGTNTGWGIPYIYWDLAPRLDYVDVMAVPKGFGSEIRATQCWVLTSEDIAKATVKAVLDVVEDAMGEPCPPIILGLGIGGFADSSMAMARKAMFRTPVGTRNPDPVVADLEGKVLEAVNALKLGPMGFGGSTYALAVHAEINGSHTAIVPISVMFQCWANRYSKARIYNDGRVQYLTHPQGGSAQ
jgi:fumarate hydratase subunit alpha